MVLSSPVIQKQVVGPIGADLGQSSLPAGLDSVIKDLEHITQLRVQLLSACLKHHLC